MRARSHAGTPIASTSNRFSPSSSRSPAIGATVCPSTEMHALPDYIRVYDGALAPDFCARLVAGFEQTHALQKANGRGVLAGLEQSAWTELDIGQLADEAFRGFFLAEVERSLARYNADIGL